MRNWKPDARWLCALLLATACSAPPPPEQRVREFVARAETLAETREYTELAGLIDAGYLDSRGNDRLKAAALLRGFFLRYKSVHLLTRIDRIDLPTPEHALVTLYVAMAQHPLDENALPDADIFKLELELVADGDSFTVFQTRWQRASAAEFVF